MNKEKIVHQLFVGYCNVEPSGQVMLANSSVTLVKSESKIILFDTLTAWNGEELLRELKSHGVEPEQVDFVVCSHGHSDHIGNLNLFLNAHHFVGSSMSYKNTYYIHDFNEKPYVLDKEVEVISTPGHTKSCISLIVRNTNLGDRSTVGIAGDLFEREEDVFNEAVWIDAGSEDEKLQRLNRSRLADMVDFIIPGHGPMFQVTNEMREKLKKDVQ